MYVLVKGFAYVDWTERSENNGSEIDHGDGVDNESVSYTAKEKYVKTKVVLLDGGEFLYHW